MSSSVYSNTVSLDVEEEEPVSLSDLVRTAETSRLRRRGAITGAHRARQSSTSSFVGTSGDASSNVPQYQPSRQIMRVPMVPPPWVDPNSTTQPQVQMQMQMPWSADVSDPTKAEDDADGVAGSGYALYCGVETWEFGDDEPYDPSPIPLFADDYPMSEPSYPPQRVRKSTGCGTLIHTNGLPRPKSGTWQACGKASTYVVPLDKAYFERGGQSKLFSCGCRWHGVGCSNCGNALGNVYMPCQVATTTSSLSRESSRTSRGSNSSPNAHFIYTFFSDTVSSAPGYEFSKCPSGDGHHSRSSIVQTMDAAAQTWDGVSEYTAYGYAEQDQDQDQEQEQEQEEPGAEYDRDGVLIVHEPPGSPDKPSAETMLWPAR